MEITVKDHTVYLRQHEDSSGWVVTVAEPTVGGSLNHEVFTSYEAAVLEFAATLTSILTQ